MPIALCSVIWIIVTVCFPPDVHCAIVVNDRVQRNRPPVALAKGRTCQDAPTMDCLNESVTKAFRRNRPLFSSLFKYGSSTLDIFIRPLFFVTVIVRKYLVAGDVEVLSWQFYPHGFLCPSPKLH